MVMPIITDGSLVVVDDQHGQNYIDPLTTTWMKQLESKCTGDKRFYVQDTTKLI